MEKNTTTPIFCHDTQWTKLRKLKLTPMSLDVMKEQKCDDVIAPVYRMVETDTKIGKGDRKKLGRDTKILLKQISKLEIDHGVLMRKTNHCKQIVLPKMFHPLVYTELHEKLAHLGSEKVLDLARKRFYWPRMQNHVEFYIKKQCRCLV